MRKAAIVCLIAALVPMAAAQISEGFDDILTLPGDGWVETNNSSSIGSTGYFQGNSAVFPAFSGAATSYLGVNFNSVGDGPGSDTISNWMIAPEVTLNNGDTVSFYTRTADGSIWPDRLQLRMSTSGSSTNVGGTPNSVGDFTGLLIDVNPTLLQGLYPETWTQYSATVTGLGGATAGRLALRYFVTDGGPAGANSNYIGIDSFEYTPVPEPSTLALLGLGVVAVLRRR